MDKLMSLTPTGSLKRNQSPTRAANMELENLLEQRYHCKECDYSSKRKHKVENHITTSHQHLLTKRIKLSDDGDSGIQDSAETAVVEKPWADLFTKVPKADQIIFGHLDKESFLTCRQVCWRWRKSVNQYRPKWKEIHNLEEKDLKIALESGHKYLAQVLICHSTRAFFSKAVLPHFAKNLACAQMVINMGADVNTADYLGKTPLHDAASEGNTEVAEVLIRNGAQVNCRQYHPMYSTQSTPLHMAAKYCHKEMVELLIANGADTEARDLNGWSALHYAAAYRNERAKVAVIGLVKVAVIGLLMQNGVDVNAICSRRGARESDRIEHTTPLMLATLTDSDAPVECLIKHGADVGASDSKGCTALHYAVSEPTSKKVEMLIKAGAAVNTKRFDGYTPLDLARCLKKIPMHSEVQEEMKVRLRIVKALLSAGADVRPRDQLKGLAEGFNQVEAFIFMWGLSRGPAGECKPYPTYPFGGI